MKTMECRNFEIIIHSASNLPNVFRFFGKMKVYAKISINRISGTKKKTETYKTRKKNPRWNERATYTIRESSVRKPDLEVVVKLYCERWFGDKYIGQVKIPIRSLFDSGFRSEQPLSYVVSGSKSGTLNLHYSFGHSFVVRKSSAAVNWKKLRKFGIQVITETAISLIQDELFGG